jgi:hypothetical protein
MPNPKSLREIVARMFAIAVQAKDTEFASHLARRASDYLDQAVKLERAAAKRSQSDEPERT